MTPEETKKAIEVMQGYVDGKEIEYYTKDFDDFWEGNDSPGWNWAGYKYRIKPQQVSIPATEEDIAVMQNYTFVKHRNTGYIHPLTWDEFAQIELYRKKCLIFNPDTKCWEDWGKK